MDLYMADLMNAEITRFPNDNSLLQDGQWYAGPVVVPNTDLWVEPLLTGISALRAELEALTKVLYLR